MTVEFVSTKMTRRALDVLHRAHQATKARHEDAIGTESILLGIAIEGQGLASQILHSLGISSERIWREMGNVESLPTTKSSGNFWQWLRATFTRREERAWDALGFSSDGRHCIELAARQAQRLDHRYIGTEHLLLGLLCVDNQTTQQLRSWGVNVDAVEQQMRRRLAG